MSTPPDGRAPLSRWTVGGRRPRSGPDSRRSRTRPGDAVAVCHRIEHLGQIQADVATGWSRPTRYRTADGPGRRRSGSRGNLSGSVPMSPPPWTLFWPRSGVRPAPKRPTCPVGDREVADREHVVDPVVVFGDAERPTQLCRAGRGVGVGEFTDRVDRDTGHGAAAFSVQSATDAANSSKPRCRPLDEAVVGQPRGDDLAGDRVGEGDVGADVEAEPPVGELCGLRASRVDDVEPSASIDGLQHVMEEDRVGAAARSIPRSR